MSKSNENTFKPNTNTGFLNVSTEKTSENAPDYFGQIDLDGVLYKIGGWRKTSEKDEAFISVSLDDASLSEDEAKEVNQRNLDAFKAERKKKENKGTYLLMEGTGTIHKAPPEEEKDFFGTFMLNGEKVYIEGFSGVSKTSGKPIVNLKKSTGLSKEKRSEIADSIL